MRGPGTYPWGEEQVEVFVQQDLVLGVPPAEVLQEGVGQGHDVIHLLVTLGGEGTKPNRKGTWTEVKHFSQCGTVSPFY